MAQKERQLISERTKLQAAKRRGQKLGMSAKPKRVVQELVAVGHAANAAATLERLEAIRPQL